jgi:hypothetical protein
VLLRAFADQGMTPDWFAAQVAELYQGATGKERRQVLKMISEMVKQREGSKLNVSGVSDERTAALQERYRQLVEEATGALEGGGEDQGGVGPEGAGSPCQLPAPAES